MRAIPFALSVHHFISTVGADAGFAAIVGLAILVLLFFAQARETASLRQRLTDSDEQMHRLELYVDQLARSSAPSPPPSAGASGVGQPPIAVPAARPPAAALGGPASDRAVPVYAGAGSPVASRTAAPAPIGVMAGIPAAPAGVGAPALSAATRLIPVPDSGPISVRSMKPAASEPGGAGLEGAAGGAALEGAAGAAALEGPAGGPARKGAAAVMAPPSPPPSTAAGGNGGSAVRVEPLAAGGGGDQTSPRPAIRRSNGSTAPPGRRRAVGTSRGGRINRGAIAIVAALVVVIAVAGLLVLTGSGGNSGKTASVATPSSTPNGAAESRSHRRSTNTVVPSSVTVAVLNGTATSNLAHNVMLKLSAVGFKQGAIATASDQTLTTTIVGYLPKFRRQAVAVARSLKLGPASVQAVSPTNQTVACSASATACAAQVVVTVGSDLAPNT